MIKKAKIKIEWESMVVYIYWPYMGCGSCLGYLWRNGPLILATAQHAHASSLFRTM